MENSTGRVRKKWSDNPMNIEMPISAPAVKEHINPQYEHYLLLLQQRNRMLRKLMTKTSQEISLERKEQGFTLYMNGANAEMDIHPTLPQLKSPSPNHEARSRRHRAAAQLMARRNRFFLDQNYLKELESDIQRQRQAPLTKRSRKRWNIKSIKSRLAGMDEEENCRVSYEDDFESDDSLSSSDSEDDKDLIDSSTEEECLKVQSLENKLNNNNNYKQNQQNSPEHKLTLSIADIKKLKVSLEMNSVLRKSIMEELSSGEESDCSIPEELNENDTNNSISGSVNLQQNLMKPADFIVLEFGTPSCSWEKNFISSKQKDYDTRPTTEFTSHDKSTSPPGLRPENEISNDFIKFQLLGSSHDADHNHNQNPKQLRKHHSQFESHSRTLTEQQVYLITKNVLRMRPRQQVNLMKMLGKLEETADTEVSERHQEAEKEPQNQVLHPHRKVRLELLSNWGHNKRIGLTEIQLYDTSGKIIPVLPENVTVKNSSNPSNSILVVFNGKAKTSKLKNMWSCDKSDTAPVTITIHPLAEKSLSKIKLWNYNHSLKNLNIGVNLIKVFINDKLLYSGSVEKGCGNHIFDFSTTIELGASSNNRSSSPSLEPLTPSNNNNSLTRHNSLDCDLSKHLRKRDTASSAPASRCPSRGRKRSISLSPLSPPLSAGHPISRKNNLPLSNSHEEIIDDSKDLSFSLLTSKKFTTVKSKSPCPSRKTCSPRAKFDIYNQKEPWDVLFSENDQNSSQNNSQNISRSNDSPNGVPVSPRTHQNTVNLNTFSDATRTTGKKEKKSKDSLDWLENDILPKHLHCHDNHTSNCPRGSNMEASSNYQVDIVDRLEEPLKDFQLSSPAKNGKSTLFDGHFLDEELQTAHQSTIRLRNMLDKIEKHVSLPSRSGSSQEKEILEPSSPGSVSSLRTILDEEYEKSKYDSLAEEMQEQEFGMYTPMQKIQKRRAKWRHLSESNLEESWGSLNYFNHLHRGRLSVDGDALDEYLLEDKVPVFQSESSAFQNQQAEMLKADEDFTIPELPYGQELVIDIKTTWGDKHYVGLTGIDIFSEKGEPVTVKRITANPKDINVLPQYNKDPRVVQNLIDGVNRTRDDVHMWLTPFTAGSNHYVTLTFTEPCHIALIRIWNYNKSRIHSFRGAREVDILLDRRLIFSGEIARACGGVEGGTEAFGDTILFSVEEEILEAVSRNDDAYEGETLEDISWEDEIDNQRPTTVAQADEDRPFTRACGNTADLQDHMSTLDLMDSFDRENSSALKGKCLKLNFTETWGDLHYLGLTGLEVFSTDKETLQVNVNMLSAEPSDLHSLPGHEQDERTLDKLINGTNVTNSDENMWLIPFTPDKPHIVCFEFPEPVTISGIRVWNYNKNPEDTYRGARIVHVEIDGRTISPPDGYLLRKGLGSCPFDFGQEISFSSTGILSFGSKSPNPVKDRRCPSSEMSDFCYETVSMPCGFIYQLQLFCTWGDPYYIGLNGIELYDADFYKIPLDETNVAAYPDSVNVLTPNAQTDIRTPDKLVDGENDTKDGAHMWLAPVLPSVVNKVYIIFDEPTTVSMIKIWNYRKTPSRAAKDIALLVDDLLVCNGSLPAVNNASRGILPTCDIPHPYHTLLFTENKEVLKRERHTVISNYTPLTQGQEIQMTNERKVVTVDNSNRGKQQNVNQAMRPTTCVSSPANKRPY